MNEKEGWWKFFSIKIEEAKKEAKPIIKDHIITIQPNTT
jgi:hypothetical protein